MIKMIDLNLDKTKRITLLILAIFMLSVIGAGCVHAVVTDLGQENKI